MKVAYIAGPYRSPKGEYFVLQNIQRASEFALKYWSLGYAVICPHRNTAFFGGALPDRVWLDGDLELLARSDVIVMIPGWKASAGARMERGKALELHKEIIYEVEL